jgi:ubiquinone/menaquinone biosynthesis C-methylase UbiE
MSGQSPRPRRGLEQIPWFYDAWMHLMERFGLSRWRAWLAEGSVGRTLEIGCGTGRNLPLYPTDAKVVGLDPHRAVLLAARRRAPGVPLVVASAESLPFRDASFDTVVSSLSFCSVGDPALGFAEVRRVLAATGRLRMLEHVRHRRPAVARVQDLIQPLWTAITGGCHPNRDTEALVEASGFRIEAEGRRSRRSLRRFQARPHG